ncbi:guanylate kinase [Hydrogenobacter hydrogenophilus]|uniref:Guanylate kinase n=1 Tax=Hydrogenobacter hydrogenophilus TaxID=35835 RepID=A0A285P5C3_9AQUI|nr:guanylate kinase [Hydrogenobacter hydrogenophilus]SNZ15356.1 guanylate kinase [Hydrogenobacter hydrogenophilus]
MGHLFVLSAPSGTGKTTVAEKLVSEVHNVKKVITATTRQKREGEVEGVDYIFMTKEEFEEGIKRGIFLEYALVYGNYYGTPKEQVEKILKQGKDALLVIDVQGAKSIREKLPESILIFLLPPSLEELKRRLITRGYRDKNLLEREQKVKMEIACARHFDYIVVNDFLDKAVEAIKNIINAHRHTRITFFRNIENLVKDANIKEIMLKGKCDIFLEEIR